MKGNIPIKEISKALGKYYWPRIEAKENNSDVIVSAPVLDLIEHVNLGVTASLDKKEECSFGGSVLLFSILEGTDRKYSYDIDETNELYKVGKNLAVKIWDALNDGESVEEIIKQIKQSLSDDYHS